MRGERPHGGGPPRLAGLCREVLEVRVSDNNVRGRFVWHELMTTNIQSAAEFFGAVVGWGSQGWDQNASYSMFTMNGHPKAGLMALPEDAAAMGARPSWMSYIDTPDVDATVKQAMSLGGNVLKEPTDIPTIGRFAVLQDPQGAVFLPFAPLQSMGGGAPPAPAVGEFSWHELFSTDWQAGRAF